MQLFAASVQEPADLFLHAGYISAHAPAPRAMSPETAKEIFQSYEPVIKLDMGEALRLKGEAVGIGPAQGKSGAEIQQARSKLDVGALGAEGAALSWGLACFFVGLALLYRLKDHLRRRQLSAAIAALVLLLTGFAALAGGFGSIAQTAHDSPPPWQGIARRAYAHPQAATQAILYGIIADAAANCPHALNSLADIQKEVGLPARKLTEGQQYALATYGLDGWGRPFRLARVSTQCLFAKGDDQPVTVPLEKWSEFENKGYAFKRTIPAHYSITSDGQDGTARTPDDVELQLAPFAATSAAWERQRWGYFVQQIGERHTLFVHRSAGPEYRAHNGWRARKLTGSNLFDAMELLEGSADSVYRPLAKELPYHPLVLVVFRTPNGDFSVRKPS